MPARRFSPDFWRDRYEAHRLTQDVKLSIIRKAKPQASTATVAGQMSSLTFAGTQSGSFAAPVPRMSTPEERKRRDASRKAPPRKLRWREEWLQFSTLLRRAFLSKLRNIASLCVTLLAPPALAAIVGWALYFTKESDRPYVFASAFHIPTYIFIALLVALFLALMNSVEDIIRDRTVLQRERNLDVRMGYYVTAKFFTLCVFSALQCTLFVVVANNILEVRGMFVEYFTWMFLTAVSGISLGLLVSALVPNSKTAALIVPLILIPQLIFGGALIKYEEMNKDPDLLYAFQRWFESKKTKGQPDNEKVDQLESDKKLRVPLISRFVATHYSYEALVVAQAKLNPLAVRQDKLTEMVRTMAAKKDRTELDEDRLEDLKDTLAQLSGLEAGSAREIDRRLKRVDEIIAGSTPTRGDFKTRVMGVTVSDLYDNQKIADMVAKAESEQADYRRKGAINVFFSPQKHHSAFGWPDGGVAVTVWVRNTLILGGSSLAMLVALSFILRRQLQRSGV
ncbi:MAG: ABC transporter permease [Chthoniobacter sp.]